ncbi:hypothetical protein [Microcoleus vaginatus]|uniref:hypothetical protein n=1 Tax=Microcoleus vaginatus TaxID=119532 RepID=UPI00058757EB
MSAYQVSTSKTATCWPFILRNSTECNTSNPVIQATSMLMIGITFALHSNQVAPQLRRWARSKKGRSHPANGSRLTKVRQSPRSPRFSTRYNKCNHT